MSLPYVNPVDGQTAWAHEASRHIHSNTFGTSPDYLINRTKHGTILQKKPTDKVYDLGNLPVTWSRAAHGGLGDMRLIIKGVTEVPSASLSSSSFPMTWICDSNVPDLTMSDYILANPGTFDPVACRQYIRVSGVNYDPQFPEPTASATVANPHGRYWRAISGGGSGVSVIDWDQNAAIPQNTFVRVSFNKAYNVSFTASSGQTFPPLNAGIFITEFDVPDSGSRSSGNYYYPFFPYWDGSHEVTVSGSTYNRLYFKEIKPYNMVGGCENNRTVATFSDTWKSGSGFSYQLPYTG
jgi:hypothetical protein